MMDNELFINLFLVPFDDENKDDENKDDKDNKDDNDKGKDKKFTQTEVDKIVTTRLAKSKTSTAKRIADLEKFKVDNDLTTEQVESLELQIQSMKDESKTKDELKISEIKTLTMKHTKELDKVTNDSAKWKNLYQNSTIDRGIIDAAITNKAYNPDQILSILKPNTSLVEVMDEGNKPTGEFSVKVKIKVTEKDGDKDIVKELTLSPNDAVKKLSENEKFMNLFVSDAKGGLGGFNINRSGKGSEVDQKDTSAFMKDRKKNNKKG